MFRVRRWVPRPKKFLTLLAALCLVLFVSVSIWKLHGFKVFNRSPPYSMKEAALENYQRLLKVEETCRKYKLGKYKETDSLIPHPPVPQYSVFYFDREHKIAVCPIYKAGSSTWLMNLLNLVGFEDYQVRNSGKQLSAVARQFFPELDAISAEKGLKSSWTILTVRHPFERILSAYRDKLENINVGREHGTLHFYHAFGSKIVQKYRAGGNKTKTGNLLQPGSYLMNPNHSSPEGIEPTFEEFVRYLIDKNLAASSDDHWIPFYLFCTPCLVKYDFLAHVETLGRDQQYIFEIIGLEDYLTPKWVHKTQFHEPGETSEVAKYYFRQLTSTQIHKLHEKYHIDFELFDYDYKPYLKYAKDHSDVIE